MKLSQRLTDERVFVENAMNPPYGREAHLLTQFVMAQVMAYEDTAANCPPGENPYAWRVNARRELHEAIAKACGEMLEGPSRLMRHMEQDLVDVEMKRLRAIIIEERQ